MNGPERYGWALRLLRELRKLTQRQLAEKLGVHPSRVSAWERGKSSPSLELLSRLAEVLDFSLGDLGDAIAVSRNQPLQPYRLPVFRQDYGSDRPRMMQLLLGSPGLLPITRAERSLSGLLEHLAWLIHVLQSGEPPREAQVRPDLPPVGPRRARSAGRRREDDPAAGKGSGSAAED